MSIFFVCRRKTSQNPYLLKEFVMCETAGQGANKRDKQSRRASSWCTCPDLRVGQPGTSQDRTVVSVLMMRSIPCPSPNYSSERQNQRLVSSEVTVCTCKNRGIRSISGSKLRSNFCIERNNNWYYLFYINLDHSLCVLRLRPLFF